MAVYYGPSPDDKQIKAHKQYELLNYEFMYSSPNYVGANNWIGPEYPRGGYPNQLCYVYGLDEESSITFLLHKFDQDVKNLQNDFRMKYRIKYIMKNGSVGGNRILFTKKIKTGKVGNTNIYVLNKTFKFSDVIPQSRIPNIFGFYVEFQCDTGTIGNESNISTVIRLPAPDDSRTPTNYWYIYNDLHTNTIRYPYPFMNLFDFQYVPMPTYGMDEKSTFELCYHRFDNDDTVGFNLNVTYHCLGLFSDGTTRTVKILDSYIESGFNVRHNLIAISRVYNISELFPNWKNLVSITIGIQRKNPLQSYGNESVVGVITRI